MWVMKAILELMVTFLGPSEYGPYGRDPVDDSHTGFAKSLQGSCRGCLRQVFAAFRSYAASLPFVGDPRPAYHGFDGSPLFRRPVSETNTGPRCGMG